MGTILSIKKPFSFFFQLGFGLLLLCLNCPIWASSKILMFVSHEDTYYSEYIVMHEALTVSGYTVDVRSASHADASIYMIPANTDIEATANTLANSTYADFTNQFQALFGASWNSGVNTMPAFIPVNGRIQDVVSMSGYKALVVVGGTGALAYRVDGSYGDQGNGGRLVLAADIQAAAEKLNALALEAVTAGKPVIAQCHSASLPAFWRIPGTSGPGEEALGYSLIKGQYATGFPEAQTPVTLTSLDITHRTEDRLTVTSPWTGFDDGDNGDSRIMTTRDWYPQTVAHAARTLINILHSYPIKQNLEANYSVLLLHGGAIDTGNCSAGNRSNDVPCNYGNDPINLPADYTNLSTLLQANSTNDNFSFTVTDINVTDVSLPYDPNDTASIETYLNGFDTVIFFKHWSTGVNSHLQNAMVNYADSGGGVLALHHGLYNDIDNGDPSLNKDILANQLFNAHSAESTWSANRTNYQYFSTNYGHFISSYGVSYGNTAQQAPAVWNTNPLLETSNTNDAYFQNFSIYDEIYNNMSFLGSPTFGQGINEITPLFSNDQSPDSQAHVTGFARLFDASLDSSVGKAAFFQAAERPESFDLSHPYAQVVRNAVAWLAVPYQVDSDSDGTEDILDDFPLDPSEVLDTDSDTVGNNADGDDDNDGAADAVDADPLDASNHSEITLQIESLFKGTQSSKH